MHKVPIGIIGCGNISAAYLKAMTSFPILDIRGIGDLNADLATARAAEFDVASMPVEDIYNDPDIEIIVNLTIPKAHVAVATRTLESGKHAYSEKPLAITFAEGKALTALAAGKGLRIGAAPDTFFGGAHQTARALIDQGVLGIPVGGTATMMRPGHESWHPNPDFYYEAGGGPLLDMGPYYITNLVNLYGPVETVTGVAITPRTERVITSEPRKGERIPVHVPTHIAGIMTFRNGAVIQISMSFDVAGHKHLPLEIYGTEGTLIVPDPNYFGGDVQLIKKGGEFGTMELTAPYADDNYRSIGVADLAYAIRNNRPHRASGALALHVLEVMEAIQTAARTGSSVAITTIVERPAPLAEALVDMKLAQ